MLRVEEAGHVAREVSHGSPMDETRAEVSSGSCSSTPGVAARLRSCAGPDAGEREPVARASRNHEPHVGTSTVSTSAE